jgi:glyoxylase-like metal-dependent hydrolase (beta-lactamase superfamily II)
VLERPAGDKTPDPPALVQFLESLAKVETLEIDQVYPGHGQPFSDHRAVIQRQRDRLRLRLNECVSLIETGHRTVAALLEKMYPGQLHLTGLWMLIGYLHLLQAEKRVDVEVVNGVWRYESIQE